MFTEDQIRRFFKHVYKTDGCWLWTGHTVQSVRGGPPVLDYGVLRSGNKDYRAHRFAYLAFVGPIPEGMDICHKCDVPRCVNPDHLFPGTAADNAADKVAKGRSLRGSRNPYSKLTEDDVRSIRAIFSTGNVTRNDLAIQYGVYRSTISRIVRGDSWKHIL